MYAIYICIYTTTHEHTHQRSAESRAAKAHSYNQLLPLSCAFGPSLSHSRPSIFRAIDDRRVDKEFFVPYSQANCSARSSAHPDHARRVHSSPRAAYPSEIMVKPALRRVSKTQSIPRSLFDLASAKSQRVSHGLASSSSHHYRTLQLLSALGAAWQLLLEHGSLYACMYIHVVCK
jgi:hypothetical protein